MLLSYDIAVIKWIMSCHEIHYDHTRNNTLGQTRKIIDNARVSNVFSYWNDVHFEVDKIPF